MKLSEFKNKLNEIIELTFTLPSGEIIPTHFHITEVGQVSKHFIDCGGTVRTEKKVNFQFWEANDYDHRLAPQKLKKIIALSEYKLGIEDGEIEVEYQISTIGKYGIEYNGTSFMLTSTNTACLASDHCGIPVEKLKVNLKELQAKTNKCCTTGSGC